jgi:hypothetical protein
MISVFFFISTMSNLRALLPAYRALVLHTIAQQLQVAMSRYVCC